MMMKLEVREESVPAEKLAGTMLLINHFVVTWERKA